MLEWQKYTLVHQFGKNQSWFVLRCVVVGNGIIEIVPTQKNTNKKVSSLVVVKSTPRFHHCRSCLMYTCSFDPVPYPVPVFLFHRMTVPWFTPGQRHMYITMISVQQGCLFVDDMCVLFCVTNIIIIIRSTSYITPNDTEKPNHPWY